MPNIPAIVIYSAYSTAAMNIRRLMGSKFASCTGFLTVSPSTLWLMWSRSTLVAMWFRKFDTGFECQRPPPISKKARCPPRDVVRQTV